MIAPLRSLLEWLARHSRSFYGALGAYLIVGLATCVAALASFGYLASLVAAGATQRFDERVLLWMNARSSPFLDEWAPKLTMLGSTVPAVMIVVVASIALWISRHRWSVLLLWVAMLGSAVLSSTLKTTFDRPRPELWERMHAGAASFPSGHAMTAVVIYGTLAYLVARLEPGRALRIGTYALTLIVVGIIGFTRLYLGVHYPSDVAAGYAIALAWATICAVGIEAVRFFAERRPGTRSEEADLERGVLGEG